jgi:hypothetical protein
MERDRHSRFPHRYDHDPEQIKITEYNGTMGLRLDRFGSEIVIGNTIMHKPEVKELVAWIKTTEG